MLSWNAFKTSNKLKKIGLKELNSCNFKVGRLNLIKVSKWTNSNFYLKLKD